MDYSIIVRSYLGRPT